MMVVDRKAAQVAMCDFSVSWELDRAELHRSVSLGY